MMRDLRTPLCDLLGCAYPIIQAGMGGVARHHPDQIPRRVLAEEDGRPIHAFSTESPLPGIAAAMGDVTADFEARKSLRRELEGCRRMSLTGKVTPKGSARRIATDRVEFDREHLPR
jgi:hypothetical protein